MQVPRAWWVRPEVTTGTGIYALFGGTTQLAASGALAQAVSLDSTWLFDLKTQGWTLEASSPNVPVTFKETYDQEASSTPEDPSCTFPPRERRDLCFLGHRVSPTAPNATIHQD